MRGRRTRPALRIAALAAAAAASCAPGAQAASGSASPRHAVLALQLADGRATLSRRDAATLAPTGPGLAVRGAPEVWARSPGGRYLALADGRHGLAVVDVRRLRLDWRLSRRILARALVWLSPGRLALVEHGAVLVLDPGRRRVVARGEYEGTVLAAARWRGGLVALAGSGEGRIAPARLLVAGPDARVRSVELPGIVAGVDGGENNAGPWRGAWPALAVDPSGRAFVAGGGRVVSVDLTTLAVDAGPVLRAPQKLAAGPTRFAALLADGTLAVAGYDLAVRRDGGGEVADGTPYGLHLLRGGSARTADPAALQVRAAGALALAYGAPWWLGPVPGAGLAAYDAAGRLRWRALPDAAVDTVAVAGGRAYARAQGAWHVVDLASGRVLASRRAPDSLLLLDG